MEFLGLEPVKIITERLTEMGQAVVGHLPHLALGLVILLLTWAVAASLRRAIARVVRGSAERRSLRSAIQKLITIGVWIAGIAVTATVIFPTIKPSNLLAGLGLGSVAVGFAFKDIFENFFAGMLILFRQPYRIGDYIEIQDIEGQIEDITVRDTRVRQTDGQPVILPNAMLFKEPVTVRTDRDLRRVDLECGVAYDTDVAEAREVIREAVESLDSVAESEPIQVSAKEFGSSSINFEVRWWTGSEPSDVRESRDAAIEAIVGALGEAGIEIPYPYRTVEFRTPLYLGEDEEDESQRTGSRKREQDDGNGEAGDGDAEADESRDED